MRSGGDTNRESIEFDRAVSAARNADALWLALRELSHCQPGHKLFTVMTLDMEAGLARRVYSDHPHDYPVSGTKPIHRDAWFDVVHGEKRSFVANTIEDIARVFPDHELIRALGCGSVFNLPIVIKGELVATINMLHESNHYNPERVAAAEAHLAVPAKLCWALAVLFDSPGKKLD